jgi:NADPH:quinone reductase-like Zn-dependent oxidoreductase
MASQKAIIITAPKQEGLVTDRALPALRDDYILVKTEAVALNPTDWKHVAFLSPPGVLVGCDYAGVVEAVGGSVKKSFKKGDRVCGFIHGANTVQPEDGAFAEYIVAKGDIQMRIPDNLSFQEAATLGVGITTVGQALYQSLKLALPTEPLTTPEPILIYGGSTATGALAIQFAQLSGYTVLTTCSPHNFGLVRRLGADKTFDYKDPSSAAAIRACTNNKLKLVLTQYKSRRVRNTATPHCRARAANTAPCWLWESSAIMSTIGGHWPTRPSARSSFSAILRWSPSRRIRILQRSFARWLSSCWPPARSRCTLSR